MAVRSEAAAQSAWSKAKTRSPDLYRGAKLDIQRADLGAKGVYFPPAHRGFRDPRDRKNILR